MSFVDDDFLNISLYVFILFRTPLIPLNIIYSQNLHKNYKYNGEINERMKMFKWVLIIYNFKESHLQFI